MLKNTVLVGALRFGGVVAMAMAALGGCEQEKILCATSHGEYAVKYTPLSGSGACAGLPGGTAGVETYVKGSPSGRPMFEKPPLAIKPTEIGALVAAYGQAVDNTKLSAIGEFVDKSPDGQGFCRTGPMSAATVTLAAVPATTDPMGMMKPALPAVSVTYEWSDLRFYVTAANPGSMFTGKLKYTMDGCVAEYAVVGLSPAAGCERTAGDMGTGMPDDTLCSPCADVAAGRATGSGIAPNIETLCDPKLLMCVPRSAPPSLRTTTLRCMPTGKPPAIPDAGAADKGGGGDAPAADVASGDGAMETSGDNGVDRAADAPAETAGGG